MSALCAFRRSEIDVDFAVMHALGVLIEFGAAGAAPDRFHLRDLGQQLLRQQSEPMRFRERNAGIVLQRQNQRSLVEGGQKTARHQARGIAGNHDSDGDRTEHKPAPFECPAKQPPVRLLQAPHHRTFAVARMSPPGKQIVGQDRRHRDRGQQRGEYRHDVGNAERREQPTLDSGKREQRHEYEDDDHRRIDDAGANLLARLSDHFENRPRLRAKRSSP